MRLTFEQLGRAAGGEPRSLVISCANTNCTTAARWTTTEAIEAQSVIW